MVVVLLNHVFSFSQSMRQERIAQNIELFVVNASLLGQFGTPCGKKGRGLVELLFVMFPGMDGARRPPDLLDDLRDELLGRNYLGSLSQMDRVTLRMFPCCN